VERSHQRLARALLRHRPGGRRPPRELYEPKENPEVASRNRYVRGLPPGAETEGWMAFAADDDPHIDPEVRAADLERLLVAEKPIRDYMNESVAHAELERDGLRSATRPSHRSRRLSTPPTW
jgi:hypothetical protein